MVLKRILSFSIIFSQILFLGLLSSSSLHSQQKGTLPIINYATGHYPKASGEFLNSISSSGKTMERLWATSNKGETKESQQDILSQLDSLKNGDLFIGLIINSNLIEEGKDLSLKKYHEDSTISSLTDLLILAYLNSFSKNLNELPLESHFNGGLGNYIGQKASIYGADKQKIYALALQKFATIIENSPGNSFLVRELMADICMNLDDPSGIYLAGALYYYNHTLSPERQKVPYLNKSIFALETPVRGSKKYNRIRAISYKMILKDEIEKGIEVQNQFASKLAEMKPKTFEQFGSINFVDFGKRLQDITLWDEQNTKLMEFLNREVQFEKNRKVGVNPNDDGTNPGLDVKAIKSNPKYNYYAIFLIIIVLGAVGYIWKLIAKADAAQNS